MPLTARPGTSPVRPLPGHRAVSSVLSGVAPVHVHLQPVVDLATGAYWGAEALARFPGHPDPGPAAWFDAALRDGRGPALEALTLRAALDVLPRLAQPLRLTVNLSAQALLTPAVQDLLLGAGDPRLVVELTEHEHVEDYGSLLAVLGRLRDAGTALGIDDFGAGHSSWRHVLRLEPEVLKLDLSLVQTVATCPRRQALVAAMVAFCDRTGTVLVAEGVEERGDLRALVDLGVGHGQGWCLARPSEADRALRTLGSPPLVVLPD